MGMDFDKGRLAAKVKTKEQEFYIFATKTADSNFFSHDGGNVVSITTHVLKDEQQLKDLLFLIYEDYLSGSLADSRNKTVSPHSAFNRLAIAMRKMETLDFSDESLSLEAVSNRISDYVNQHLVSSGVNLSSHLEPEYLERVLSQASPESHRAELWDKLSKFMEHLKREALDDLTQDMIIRHAVLNGNQSLFNDAVRFLYAFEHDALTVETFQTPQVASGGEYNNALGYAFMTEQGYQYLLTRASEWTLDANVRPVSKLLMDILWEMHLTQETDPAYRKQVVELFENVLEKEAQTIESVIGKTPEDKLLTPRAIARLLRAVMVEGKPYNQAESELLAEFDKAPDMSLVTLLHDYHVLKERVKDISHGVLAHNYLGVLRRFGEDMGEVSSFYESSMFSRENRWLPDRITKSDAFSHADFFMRAAGLQPEQKAQLKERIDAFYERLSKIHQTSIARRIIEIAVQDFEKGKVDIWQKEAGMEQADERQAEVDKEQPDAQEKGFSKNQKKRGIQRIVEGFIEGIERAAAKQWEKPWNPVILPKGIASYPHNGKTGNVYNGFNAMIASSALMASGYADPRFYTFKQAQELGGNVKKGAKAVIISAPVIKDADATYETAAVKTGESFKNAVESLNQQDQQENLNSQKQEDVEKTVKHLSGKLVGLRPVYVFHISDLENMPPEHQPLDDTVGIEFEHKQDMEAFQKVVEHLKTLGLNVETGGSRAFYKVGTKDIQIPLPERFKGKDEEEVIRTIFHEAAHATKGLGVDREFIKELNRLSEKREWTKEYTEKVSYAIEEGVAELAANLMATRLGFHAGQENHAAYMKEWLIDGLGKIYGKPSTKNNQHPFDIHGNQEAFVLYKMIKDASKVVNTILSDEFMKEMEALRRHQYKEIKGIEARSPEELKQIRKNVERSADKVKMDALLDALKMNEPVTKHKHPLSEAAEQVNQALDKEKENEKVVKTANDFF